MTPDMPNTAGNADALLTPDPAASGIKQAPEPGVATDIAGRPTEAAQHTNVALGTAPAKDGTSSTDDALLNKQNDIGDDGLTSTQRLELEETKRREALLTEHGAYSRDNPQPPFERDRPGFDHLADGRVADDRGFNRDTVDNTFRSNDRGGPADHAVPFIDVLDPSRGLADGGDRVRITGTGFTDATQVMFGAVAGSDLEVSSDTALTVTVPKTDVRGVQVECIVVGPGGRSDPSPFSYF